mgnify:FL=1
MADKKVEVAKSIGKDKDADAAEPIPGFDATADVIDAPVTVNPIDYEKTTSEE